MNAEQAVRASLSGVILGTQHTTAATEQYLEEIVLALSRLEGVGAVSLSADGADGRQLVLSAEAGGGIHVSRIPLRRSDGETSGFCTIRSEWPADEAPPPVKLLIQAASLALERDHLDGLAAQREQQARDAEHRLRQFVKRAAHDLRSPLNTVSAVSQLLSLRYAERLDARADQMLAMVAAAVERSQALIGNLSAYVTVGTESDEITLVNLDEALKLALGELARKIEETAAEIDYGQLPAAMLRRSHAMQLFYQTLHNALLFRSAERPAVRVRGESSGGRITITIEDNGAGFDPGFAERVFEPFERLCGDQYPGSGLGLTICRRIVESYQGRISINSTPGRGTTVQFTLPGS